MSAAKATTYALGISIAIAAALYVFSETDASFSVASPSGANSIVKQYHFGGDVLTYDLRLNLSHGWYSSSIQILPPKDGPEVVGDDGVIFGWGDDRHLTIGWPVYSKPIHGKEHVGNIDITYKPYEPDIDRAPNGNLRKLQLHNTKVSFKEADLQGGGRYAATNEPVPQTTCTIEISGLDGKVFQEVSIKIYGRGIGRPGDGDSIVSMVGVAHTFTKIPGGQTFSMPTQAKLGSIYPELHRTIPPQQTNQSLIYGSYNPSEVMSLISWLRKGKLTMKVGLNFGQETLFYEAGIDFGNDIIGKFNACAAKTNIYGRSFQLPYAD